MQRPPFPTAPGLGEVNVGIISCKMCVTVWLMQAPSNTEEPGLDVGTEPEGTALKRTERSRCQRRKRL